MAKIKSVCRNGHEHTAEQEWSKWEWREDGRAKCPTCGDTLRFSGHGKEPKRGQYGWAK